MKDRLPTLRPVLDFTPVPRKYRVDGWTPERQRAFIAALAETGSVKSAAHRINMTPEGAYYLRRAPGAESFRTAWDAAIDHGVQDLRDIALDRAREGVAQPIVKNGEIVGEKRVYNDRLLMFLIRRNDQMDGISGGTKSEDRIRQEAGGLVEKLLAEKAAAAAREEEDGAAIIRARLMNRFREMAERLYEGCTDVELAANMHQMSAAEIMSLQMYKRPAAGKGLAETPGGTVPEGVRRMDEQVAGEEGD